MTGRGGGELGHLLHIIRVILALLTLLPLLRNVARIFDPLAVDDDAPFNYCGIPISPHGPSTRESILAAASFRSGYLYCATTM